MTVTKKPSYRLGFDIGGTFTDFVLIDGSTGRAFLNKHLTTPRDPAIGVTAGLEPLFEQAGIGAGEIEIAIHATTLITNALIERKGAKTAFLTSEGFRDVLEMGTEVRYDIYDLFMEKPTPLVPRQRRHEVGERLDKNGDVVVPLDRGQLEEVVKRMREDGTEAVAIAFLHSFRNAEHEQQAKGLIEERLPGIPVSISSAVAPEIREYERMSTTAANAYVQPLIQNYLERLEERFEELGFRRRLFLMLSSGGITTGQTAREYPIRLVESGPAAGVLAATHFARNLDLDSLVSFDMGGTTAKIGLVRNFEATKANIFEVGRVRRFKKGSGLPVKVPVIELIEIGAGGGSIAHVDSLGLLKVGPESAGADPGPACYGQGGDQPTVTDANVVLGYLDPGYFLGGAMALDSAAAESAISTKLADPLGLSVVEAAAGVFEIVNQNMLAAMKVHIAERGEDPRKFYLFSFGGAGPAHAYELARSLGMKGAIVPPGAGATSALGLVTSAVAFDFARSYVTRLDRVDWHDLRSVFEGMASEGLNVLEEAGIDRSAAGVAIVHSMDLRHKGQGHEVSVALPDSAYQHGSIEEIKALFYEHYASKYGHAHHNLPVELITCRTAVRAPAPDVPLHQPGDSARQLRDAYKRSRSVYFPELGEYVDTPVYDRYRLPSDAVFSGPAVIEERECTIVAGPACRIRVDSHGGLLLDIVREGAEPRVAAQELVDA